MCGVAYYSEAPCLTSFRRAQLRALHTIGITGQGTAQQYPANIPIAGPSNQPIAQSQANVNAHLRMNGGHIPLSNMGLNKQRPMRHPVGPTLQSSSYLTSQGYPVQGVVQVPVSGRGYPVLSHQTVPFRNTVPQMPNSRPQSTNLAHPDKKSQWE